MATVVNNPSSTERVIERSDDSSGWAVALILIALLVVGGFVFFRYFGAPAAAPTNEGGANIEVNVPNPIDNSAPQNSGAPANGGAANPAPAQ